MLEASSSFQSTEPMSTQRPTASYAEIGLLAAGELVSVNVGAIRTLRVGRRTVTTGIWKYPVAGRVTARGINLRGDDQADRTVHGGPDKAIYAYALEDTTWWERELGGELGAGAFGENLTVAGIDVTNALVGERWAVGTTILEVRQPRLPCFKLGLRMNDPRFPRRFAHAGRPGAYLSIVEEGDLGAGDRIEIIERPRHHVTVGLISHAYLRERTRLDELLVADALPLGWRQWITKYREGKQR
jgi:MOSC domain-containing protein YiiM